LTSNSKSTSHAVQFPLLQKAKGIAGRKQTVNSLYLHFNMALTLFHMGFSLTNQEKTTGSTK